MESGRSRKKIWGIILIAVIVLIGALFIFKGLLKDSLEDRERAFFTYFNDIYDKPNEYIIKTLDVYYYDDIENSHEKKFFYRITFSFCFEDEDEWKEVDAVGYGKYGVLEGWYNLNVEEQFIPKETNRQFEEAVKYGKHKSYTLSDIQELIAKYPSE